MRKSEGSSEVASEMSQVNGNERKMCGYEMMNPISNQVPYEHADEGNGNNHSNHHHSASATANDHIIPTNNHVNVNAECAVREQDRFMPIANVIRIMRKILPPHAKISDDAKETIQECVSEYISFVTGEANERCQREQRKTITAEDLLWAMSKLGFDDYIEPLTLYLHRYREIEGDRGSMLRSCEPFLKLNRPTPMPEQYANFGIPPRPVFHLGPPHPPHPGYFRPPPPSSSSITVNRFFKPPPEAADQSSEPPSNGSASTYDPYAPHRHD